MTIPRHPDMPRELVVGIVNNAPDAAFLAVEQRFRGLLDRAWPSGVQLRRFVLPGIARTPHGPASRTTLETRDLQGAGLDALLITGCEPSAAELHDEPFWPHLVEILQSAELVRLPLLLSCLAAHAAVLHRDGIRRSRLGEKCFGRFSQSALPGHPLSDGLPGRLEVAHSRWNELPADTLRKAGYQILTGSEATPVDMFVSPGSGRWLCLQGHPEYEPRALLGEFRRDFLRFLRGEMRDCPKLPSGCLEPASCLPIDALRRRAAGRPGAWAAAEMAALLAVASPLAEAESGASHVIRRWLELQGAPIAVAELSLPSLARVALA